MHDNDDKKRLEEIKKNLRVAHKYWQENYDRFHNMRRFLYYSTLTDDDKTKLMALKKPILSGNVLEAFVSRTMSTFIESDPNIAIQKESCLPKPDAQYDAEAEFLECHIREKLRDAETQSFKKGVFEDAISGGFGWGEVYVRYPHPRSWQYEIGVEKCYDPTLCVCDPDAKEPNKGDAEYICRIVPFTRHRFVEVYGKEKGKDLKFVRATTASLADFHWTYAVGDIEIVLVGEYYWKKRKRARIYRLSNGMSVTRKEYDELLLKYELSGAIEQPPIPVEDRMEEFTVIMRDEVCETEILSSEETPFSKHPLIFCDGNSKFLKNAVNMGMQQITRPCFYQAVGAQKLKDFAMQTMGSEIENMMMSKLLAPIEGLPQNENFLKAYTNYQQSSVITYNSYDLDTPDKQLPPPREIQRTPTPAIVTETFSGSDNLIHRILGDLNMQPLLQRDASGEAIKQSSLQASETMTPYYDNFYQFLQRVVEVMVDIIPKYYDTPRTVPVRGLDGKRGYRVINDPNDPESINIQYNPDELKVNVTAGVNVKAQKQIALKQLSGMMNMLPSMSQFIDQEAGDIIIENTDIDKKDEMQARYEKWKEKNKQQQEQTSQMKQQAETQMEQALIQKEQSAAMKNQADATSTMKKLSDAEAQFIAKTILDEQKANREFSIDTAKLAIDQERADIEAIKVQLAAQQGKIDVILRAAQIDAENARTAVESNLAVDRHHHQKQIDIENLTINRGKAANGKANNESTEEDT